MESSHAICKYLKVDFYDDCKSQCRVYISLSFFSLHIDVMVSLEIIVGI